jgi:hypothetical protein
MGRRNDAREVLDPGWPALTQLLPWLACPGRNCPTRVPSRPPRRVQCAVVQFCTAPGAPSALHRQLPGSSSAPGRKAARSPFQIVSSHTGRELGVISSSGGGKRTTSCTLGPKAKDQCAPSRLVRSYPPSHATGTDRQTDTSLRCPIQCTPMYSMHSNMWLPARCPPTRPEMIAHPGNLETCTATALPIMMWPDKPHTGPRENGCQEWQTTAELEPNRRHFKSQRCLAISGEGCILVPSSIPRRPPPGGQGCHTTTAVADRHPWLHGTIGMPMEAPMEQRNHAALRPRLLGLVCHDGHMSSALHTVRRLVRPAALAVDTHPYTGPQPTDRIST